ncbi:hypothetical protein CHBEV_322 [Choristoneura biennis entomopoxvirus]|uniref:Uncharacterized protein n=1 Tax=Choristoneura biennis entomopoxvirus TaxID=10288 RepID=A0A916KPD2_CBEPV|nr:hypothetical protein CHBEV_013 [Choristoneura biennis entomopoxvirus]YP_008004392.1 hypothetical protein CHBEV_322 [Choristoneura biennis entomopoxvirus]CCU55581.1 hypothetical protein CHBEV_013 [Choristoneura biennis entomopoxvirus]CCU55890.1 hypothetical protein CHBEV_322 [Choristoneura biennis entomopoxvirus]
MLSLVDLSIKSINKHNIIIENAYYKNLINRRSIILYYTDNIKYIDKDIIKHFDLLLTFYIHIINNKNIIKDWSFSTLHLSSYKIFLNRKSIHILKNINTILLLNCDNYIKDIIYDINMHLYRYYKSI